MDEIIQKQMLLRSRSLYDIIVLPCLCNLVRVSEVAAMCALRCGVCMHGMRGRHEGLPQECMLLVEKICMFGLVWGLLTPGGEGWWWLGSRVR